MLQWVSVMFEHAHVSNYILYLHSQNVTLCSNDYLRFFFEARQINLIITHFYLKPIIIRIGLKVTAIILCLCSIRLRYKIWHSIMLSGFTHK